MGIDQIYYDFLKDKKLLISGGLGFVGINLIKKLNKMNIRPIVMASTQNSSLTEESCLDLDSSSLYKIDLREGDEVTKLVRDIAPDFVIHLAGMTNLEKTFEKAELAIDVNLKGSLAMFKGAKGKNLKNFVFLSTSDIYGGVEPPFKETQLAYPSSPYSASKASAELFLLMFHNVYNIPVTILRSFNLYGKYQSSDRVIPFIINKLLNDEDVPLTKGEQRREFNYVDDLIDAILRSLIVEDSQGKIINIGCGSSVSIREIALMIAKKLDKIDRLKIGALEYRKNEIWDMYCDNSLAKSILKWEPKVALNDGLDMIIGWFKEHKMV